MTVRAHFDGKAFVPDEPLRLPAGTEVTLSFTAPSEGKGATGSDPLGRRISTVDSGVPNSGETIDAQLADSAWQEFRRVGERLAATADGKSLTQAVSDMRR